MNWIRQARKRRQLEQDLAEEIRQHLDETVEALMAEGMARDAAEAQARRDFGNLAITVESGRDVWRWAVIEDLIADLRFALRQLRISPVFALAAIITLAVGIGANTAVFSVVNAVLLRPLPYEEPDRLVVVRSLDVRGTPHPSDLSYPTFFHFRKANEVFDHFVSSRSTTLSLTGSGQPMHLRGQIVSWDLFQMLGVRPVIGRGFLPDEEEPAKWTVVLSYALWHDRFGADTGIVGRVVRIDGRPHRVVGVAPRGFTFPPGNDSVQVWTTLARDADSATSTPVTEQRGARMLNVIARLKPELSIEQARSQMDGVAASLAKEFPDSNRNIPTTLVQPAAEILAGSTRTPLLVLLGTVGLVMLIACANIAGLLLARTSERAREFALRAAIGAGHGRIVRQLITESLTLSLLGCSAGVLLAIGSIRFLVPLAGNAIPRIGEASVDGQVLLFSILLAIITSVLFGLAPALRTARQAGGGGLGEGARSVSDRSDRMRSALCAGQIALSLILVSGAGLLVTGFVELMTRDPGMQPDGAITFSLDLPASEYTRQRQLDFHATLLDKLRNLPGAKAAALVMPLPLTGSQMHVSFNIQDRPVAPSDRPYSDMAIITPDYFQSIGTPLLYGRDFTEQDDADAPPVLIVNRAFAEKFFPGENALGKLIEPGATSDDSGTKMREIVGVVGNARQSTMNPNPEPIYYFPYRQLPWCCPSVVFRSTRASLAMEPEIRSVVSSLDRGLPVFEVRTLLGIRSEGVAQARFPVYLLAGFAGIALLLTMVGLYGLLAYSVAIRTREIGLRMALGATQGDVLSIVFRKAMFLVVIGGALGLVGAYLGSQLLSKLLNGVSPNSPMLLTVASFALIATAAAAAYIPARRAASIEPVDALRAE